MSTRLPPQADTNEVQCGECGRWYDPSDIHEVYGVCDVCVVDSFHRDDYSARGGLVSTRRYLPVDFGENGRPLPDETYYICVETADADRVSTRLSTEERERIENVLRGVMVDPKDCVYCQGTGWVFNDKSYNGYPYGRAPYVEPDDLNGGYSPCWPCNDDREVEFGSGQEVKPWRRWDDDEVAEIADALADSESSARRALRDLTAAIEKQKHDRLASGSDGSWHIACIDLHLVERELAAARAVLSENPIS